MIVKEKSRIESCPVIYDHRYWVGKVPANWENWKWSLLEPRPNILVIRPVDLQDTSMKYQLDMMGGGLRHLWTAAAKNVNLIFKIQVSISLARRFWWTSQPCIEELRVCVPHFSYIRSSRFGYLSDGSNSCLFRVFVKLVVEMHACRH